MTETAVYSTIALGKATEMREQGAREPQDTSRGGDTGLGVLLPHTNILTAIHYQLHVATRVVIRLPTAAVMAIKHKSRSHLKQAYVGYWHVKPSKLWLCCLPQSSYLTGIMS
jgi:hypothetical protein